MVENIVGKRFESNNGGWFTVMDNCKIIRNKKHYEIEFDEYNGVKYKTFNRPDSIKSGKIKNPYYSTVCNIGYLGNLSKKDSELYNRWQNMLNRCYSPKNRQYKTYGAEGVNVCERWHSFENFVYDFKLLNGYDENNLKNLELDKDTKTRGNKIYSPETCVLITASENSKEMTERVKQKWFKAISPEGKIYKSNNQQEFALQNNLKRQSINSVLTKRSKTHKDWKFEYLD